MSIFISIKGLCPVLIGIPARGESAPGKLSPVKIINKMSNENGAAKNLYLIDNSDPSLGSEAQDDNQRRI